MVLFPILSQGDHHGNDKIVPLWSGMGMSELTDLLKLLGVERAVNMWLRKDNHL